MRRKRLLLLTVSGLLLFVFAGKRAVPADGQAEIAVETKYVALTFDDGPRAGTTDVLLDGLRQRGASATFFLVGEQAQWYPDLVRRMAAEGHQVGNHTWSHVRLEDTPAPAAAREIQQTDALLSSLLGEGSYWLRPPYGAVAPEMEQALSVPMVKWSVDPRDWESRDTAKIVDAVMNNVRPNSIVLLHDIYPASVEAALQIVDALQAEGYWFVTVEELLELNGITPQPGVMYRSGDR